MSAVTRQWKIGRALSWIGIGLMAIGVMCNLATSPGTVDWWPWILLWLGAVVMGIGQIYLFTIECPACHLSFRNHMAMAGILSTSVPIRHCPRCGVDLSVKQDHK
jgi:hypothetical protein